MAQGKIRIADIIDSQITYTKIQNVSTDARILGRYTTGAGVVQEITIGSGLSLNSTTGVLTATAGSPSMATLSDVTLTSLANGDFLKYNGSAWVNRTSANVLSDIGAQPQLSGTGFVKASGTTISYDNSTYLTRSIATQSVTSAATVTPNADQDDMVYITAQAAGLTLANPSGTPFNGQVISIRIKDNGTARSIGYGTQYRAFGAALPTTTTINKTIYITITYNSADTKWDASYVQEV